MNLTKRTIETLACEGARASQIFYDDRVQGFGVRVLAKTGRKTYVLRYRTRSGVERFYTVGPANVLTPDTARAEALRLLNEVALGRDPAGDLETLRAEPTVADVAALWLDYVKAHKKPNTLKNYKACYKCHVAPVFGSMRLSAVTESEVARLHAKMHEQKYQANRVVVILTATWRWAMKYGHMPRGPVPFREIEAYRFKPRRRRMSVDELVAAWRALDTFDGTELVNFAPLVKLLLLTGCRLSEWRDALWSWVDLDAALLRLPDSKTGEKDVQLPPEAVEILRALPKTSVYVLPGVNGGPMGGVWRAWVAFRESIGAPDLRMHDLRRTVGSMALEAGLNVREVADLLGHANTRSTEIYLSAVKEREAGNARKVAGEIVRLATGGAVKSAAVESITKRRAVSTK